MSWTLLSFVAMFFESTQSPTRFIYPRLWTSSRGPRLPNLTIVTIAGGPAVLAAEAFIGADGRLAELSANTIEPPGWDFAVKRSRAERHGTRTVSYKN